MIETPMAMKKATEGESKGFLLSFLSLMIGGSFKTQGGVLASFDQCPSWEALPVVTSKRLPHCLLVDQRSQVQISVAAIKSFRPCDVSLHNFCSFLFENFRHVLEAVYFPTRLRDVQLSYSSFCLDSMPQAALS